jgi:hypothetical protein
MMIPEFMEIQGHTVVIQRQLDGDEPVGTWGWYHAETDRLCVVDGLSPANESETFYHEVLEAYNSILELGLAHRQIAAVANLMLLTFGETA